MQTNEAPVPDASKTIDDTFTVPAAVVPNRHSMLKLPAAEVVKEPVRVTSVPPPTYPDKGRDAFARNCAEASAL